MTTPPAPRRRLDDDTAAEVRAIMAEMLAEQFGTRTAGRILGCASSTVSRLAARRRGDVEARRRLAELLGPR